MDEDERNACRAWLKSVLSEALQTLRRVLPQDVANKLSRLGLDPRGIDWGKLNRAELGTVMQAGATNFFVSTAPAAKITGGINDA